MKNENQAYYKATAAIRWIKQADRKDWLAFVDGWQRSASTGWGRGAKRIVPWGVLGLEGLLRACCARWWATSDRGSHKHRKGHQEARERKNQKNKGRNWEYGEKNTNKTWARGKEMGRQRIQGWNKKKEKEKTEAPEKQTMGLELRGDAWWPAIVRLVGEHSNPILVCPVAVLLYINVHQWPPESSNQALRMQQGRGGCQSCHKEENNNGTLQTYCGQLSNTRLYNTPLLLRRPAWSEASSGESYTLIRTSWHQAESPASNLPTLHIVHIFP